MEILESLYYVTKYSRVQSVFFYHVDIKESVLCVWLQFRASKYIVLTCLLEACPVTPNIATRHSLLGKAFGEEGDVQLIYTHPVLMTFCVVAVFVLWLGQLVQVLEKCPTSTVVFLSVWEPRNIRDRDTRICTRMSCVVFRCCTGKFVLGKMFGMSDVLKFYWFCCLTWGNIHRIRKKIATSSLAFLRQHIVIIVCLIGYSKLRYGGLTCKI